ncbi:uncharacterized protein B0H64DRAFT_427703 [Chaetomium fimeti]|uniref:NAD(P)-binding protein n=1 Tax=Chaetomium fimeti TaxID=1854472 RepID=A0AAE0H5R2_9PEZI|nr:hypothetical protein B0H64DRAFT_427703 [Chaetomium fimeti]
MSTSTLSNLNTFLSSQLRTTLPPATTHTFTSQTLIVTGANSGLGLEAARHFVAQGAARVILAVRSLSAGEAAARSIAESTGREGVAEAWELDLARYASVEGFVGRVERELEGGVDVVVANAGVFMVAFERQEEEEEGGPGMTMVVNVIGHMLLALLLLPKMRATAVARGRAGVITFTGSFTHWMTSFPERTAADVFAELADRKTARMKDRYYVSKLIQLLVVREFAEELTRSAKPGKIITSVVNPGFVATRIMRHEGPMFQIFQKGLLKMLSRTPEVGSLTLVHGAAGGEETHGQYLDDCKVGKPGGFVLDPQARATQKQLWRELTAKLENIHPGIMQNL